MTNGLLLWYNKKDKKAFAGCRRKTFTERMISMTIDKMITKDKAVISVTGRIDTNTAPELDKVMREAIKEADNVVLDLKGTVYLSSAVLRVILRAHKTLSGKGGLRIINANKTVMEIFLVTGFADILDIEAAEQ